MTKGALATLPVYVEANDAAQICLEQLESSDGSKTAALSLKLGIKIPVSALVDALVKFQQQFEKGDRGGETQALQPHNDQSAAQAALVYGAPGVNAPPPPPMSLTVVAKAQPKPSAPATAMAQPRTHDIERAPRPESQQPVVWESEICDLQPEHFGYVEHTKWRKPQATWVLLDTETLSSYEPTPLNVPTPSRCRPSDSSTELVPRYANMMRAAAAAPHYSWSESLALEAPPPETGAGNAILDDREWPSLGNVTEAEVTRSSSGPVALSELPPPPTGPPPPPSDGDSQDEDAPPPPPGLSVPPVVAGHAVLPPFHRGEQTDEPKKNTRESKQ